MENQTLATQGNDSRTAWFEGLIATLRTHELQLDTGTATPEMEAFYSSMMGNNMEEMLSMNQKIGQKYFVTSMLKDYLKELKPDFPRKLAFNIHDGGVLVWAEIKDDDEEAEKRLIMAEAGVCAKYHGKGFGMETTIVEESDRMEIPNHYEPLITP